MGLIKILPKNTRIFGDKKIEVDNTLGDELDLPSGDDDDFDLDALMSEDFGVDEEGGGRSTKEVIIQGGIDGVIDAIKSPSTYIEAIDASIPKEYKAMVDLYDAAGSATSDIAQELKRTVRPKVNKALKALNSMVPSKFTKTKGLLEKVSSGSDNESGGDDDNYESSESKDSILEALENITKQKDNVFTHKEAIMISEERVYKQGNISLLGNILSAIELGNKYEEQVAYQFRKLGIEIQHKQLDIQTRTLDAVLAQTKIQEGFLEAIRHNTSLPDFVKLQMNEQFANLTREKLLDGVREGVFGDQKGVADVVKRFKDKTIARIQGGGEESMMGQLFKDKSLAGNVAGRTVVGEAVGSLTGFIFKGVNSQGDILDSEGKKIIEKAKLFNGNYFDLNSGNPIRSLADIKSAVVDKKGKVIISATTVANGLTETGRSDNASARSKFGQRLTKFNDSLSNIPMSLRNMAKNNERKAEEEEKRLQESQTDDSVTLGSKIKSTIKSKFYRTVGDLASSAMPSTSVDETVHKETALEKHANFDSLFYRSVTESIPSLLQSILKAVGGNNERYDFKAKKMIDVKTGNKQVRGRFDLNKLGETIDKDVDDLMKEMQLDQHKVKDKLQQEIKQVLRKEYRASIQSGVNTIGSTNDILEKLPKRSQKAFKSYMDSVDSKGLKAGKDAHINRIFKNSGTYDVALRRDLSTAQSDTGLKALIEAGIFKVNKNGDVVINYDMILSMSHNDNNSEEQPNKITPSERINNPPPNKTEEEPSNTGEPSNPEESLKESAKKRLVKTRKKLDGLKEDVKQAFEDVPKTKEEWKQTGEAKRKEIAKQYQSTKASVIEQFTKAESIIADSEPYKYVKGKSDNIKQRLSEIEEDDFVFNLSKDLENTKKKSQIKETSISGEPSSQSNKDFKQVIDKQLIDSATQAQVILGDTKPTKKLPDKLQDKLDKARESYLAKTAVNVLEQLTTHGKTLSKSTKNENKDGLLGEVRDALKSVEVIVKERIKKVEASSVTKVMKNGKYISSEAEQDEVQHGQLVGVLGQIKQLMKETKERINVVAEAYEPKDASMVNENGDLLGSFKDTLWKRKQKKEAKEQKQLAKEKKEEKDSNSWMFKALGLLGTGLITGISTLVSSIGGLTSIAGGLLSLLGGGSLLGKLGDMLPDGKGKTSPSDLMENAGEALDKDTKRNGNKKQGLIKRTFKLLGKAPGALWSLGRGIGKFIPSTGTVLGGAGRLALGGLGLAARVGIGAVGALVSGTSAAVVGGVAAVGAIGYGGYKLYKGITDYPDDIYTKMRLAQYGLIEQHSKDFEKIYALETYIKENALVSKDGQFVIDNTKVNMQTVADIFMVSMASEKRMTNLVIWYKDRFTPIYLHAVEETNKRTKSTDLRQTRRLDEKDRDIIAAYSLPNGPYHIGATPLEGNIATGYAAVDEVITKQLGTEKGIGTKLLDHAVEAYDKLTELPSVSKMGYELGQSAMRKAKEWWNGKPEEPVVNPPDGKPVDNKQPVTPVEHIKDQSFNRTPTGTNLVVTSVVDGKTITITKPITGPMQATPPMVNPSQATANLKAKAQAANDPVIDPANQPDSPADAPKAPASAIKIPSATGASVTVNTGKTATGSLKDGKEADQYITYAKGATLEGLIPEFKTQLRGMIQEYGELTGKKVQINEGYRSYEEQVRMKKKYGANAATPGSSVHGSAAADIQTVDVNAMEKLGLMKKYGFTRPVRKKNGDPEGWHIEPSVVATNPNKAVKDRAWASSATVSSIGKGGGGYATAPASINGKMRNPAMAAAVVAAGGSVSTTPAASQPTTTVKGVGPINSPSAYADLKKTPPVGGSSPTPAMMPDMKGIGPINSPSAYMDKGTTRGGDQTSYYGTIPSDPPSLSAASTPTEAINNPDKKSSASPVDLSNQPDSPNTPSSAATGAQPTGDIKDLPLSNPPKDKSGIISMLEKVARVVGVNPSFLKGMIAMESQFKYDARPYSRKLGKYLSSARGIGQFLDDTWAEQIAKHGKKYGLTKDTPRENSTASAIITAEYVKANAKNLPNPNMVDGYFTHFLGPGGAKKFATASKDAPAAQVLPKAAKSNPDVFFKNGVSATVAEVYEKYKKRIVDFAAGHGITLNPNEHPLQAGSVSTQPQDSKNASASSTSDVSSPAPSNDTTKQASNTSLAESTKSTGSEVSAPSVASSASLAAASVSGVTQAAEVEPVVATSSSNDSYYGTASQPQPNIPQAQQPLVSTEGEATVTYFRDSLAASREQLAILKDIRDILKANGVIKPTDPIKSVNTQPASKLTPSVTPPTVAAVGMKRVSSS